MLLCCGSSHERLDELRVFHMALSIWVVGYPEFPGMIGFGWQEVQSIYLDA